MKAKYYLMVIVIIVFVFIAFFYHKIPFVDNMIDEYRKSSLTAKIKANPYSVENHYQLAQLYFKRSQFDKYENELNLLRQISPEAYLYSEKLADHYAKIGQIDNAIQLYKEAIKLCKKTDNLLHFKLANTYLNSGKHEQALEEYKIQLEQLKSLNDSQKTEKMELFIKEQIESIMKHKH